MSKTAIIYSRKYLQHKTGIYHPETPARLRVIFRELKKSGIYKNEKCKIINPELVKMSELEKIHTRSYIQYIKKFCQKGGGLLDRYDTVVSPESYDVALLAAGGTLKAVNSVMNGMYRNSLAFVRPPGHHSGSNYAMGFCIFNNIAIAASQLIEKFNLKRVLILDIDAHHGNGTQEIFYKSNKVLYISLHEDPIEFPLTGFTTEMGEDEGLGFSVNIPLPYGTNDKTYLMAFNEIVHPIIRQFKPQFILVSLGLDNHYSDPIGNLQLSSHSYVKIFDTLLNLSSVFCQGKMVAVLEGGYNLRILGKLACAITAKMAGIPYKMKDKRQGSILKIRKEGQKTINKIKQIQTPFWKLK
ncbi:MAG: histone deacetylase [Candidatus Bathyarchaeota archaeon]